MRTKRGYTINPFANGYKDMSVQEFVAKETSEKYRRVNYPRIFSSWVVHWGNVRTDVMCDEYTEQGTFDKYKKMSIVGIQDLGAEPMESMYMGNRINVLRQILEYRGDQTDQLTLITSNLPMNHKRFIDRYEDRVSSRLNEMCNYFEIKGKDRRKL